MIVEAVDKQPDHPLRYSGGPGGAGGPVSYEFDLPNHGMMLRSWFGVGAAHGDKRLYTEVLLDVKVSWSLYIPLGHTTPTNARLNLHLRDWVLWRVLECAVCAISYTPHLHSFRYAYTRTHLPRSVKSKRRPVLSILPTSVFPWMEKRIHSCVIRVNNASVILKCVCQVCHCVTLNYFRWNSFSKESEE